MSISEAQFQVWAHQGSVNQSKMTYQTVRNALNSSQAGYTGKSYEIFLQGSYGNDTNIRDSESDVDVVIQLNSTFHCDLTNLSYPERYACNAAYPPAIYQYDQFRQDVFNILLANYGNMIIDGNNSIKVPGAGGRRNVDVVVAMQFRRYMSYSPLLGDRYEEGICLLDSFGNQIINYPKQHAVNCTAKHRGARHCFKHMIRIFKNMRSKVVELGLLGKGVAPSYFIEGLLYNAPCHLYGHSYQKSFCEILNYLVSTDRSAFVCANKQHDLFGNGPVHWSDAQCVQFLGALVHLWNTS